MKIKTIFTNFWNEFVFSVLNSRLAENICYANLPDPAADWRWCKIVYAGGFAGSLRSQRCSFNESAECISSSLLVSKRAGRWSSDV